jgi:hypothetical protein
MEAGVMVVDRRSIAWKMGSRCAVAAAAGGGFYRLRMGGAMIGLSMATNYLDRRGRVFNKFVRGKRLSFFHGKWDQAQSNK